MGKNIVLSYPTYNNMKASTHVSYQILSIWRTLLHVVGLHMSWKNLRREQYSEADLICVVEAVIHESGDQRGFPH